jgi:hypothetical protein
MVAVRLDVKFNGADSPAGSPFTIQVEMNDSHKIRILFHKRTFCHCRAPYSILPPFHSAVSQSRVEIQDGDRSDFMNAVFPDVA